MKYVKLNECDTKQLLTQILKRLGMYVGKERLDYSHIFLMGWMAGRYDISINGWLVFYDYFGTGKKSIDHFSR